MESMEDGNYTERELRFRRINASLEEKASRLIKDANNAMDFIPQKIQSNNQPDSVFSAFDIDTIRSQKNIPEIDIYQGQTNREINQSRGQSASSYSSATPEHRGVFNASSPPPPPHHDFDDDYLYGGGVEEHANTERVHPRATHSAADREERVKTPAAGSTRQAASSTTTATAYQRPNDDPRARGGRSGGDAGGRLNSATGVARKNSGGASARHTSGGASARQNSGGVSARQTSGATSARQTSGGSSARQNGAAAKGFSRQNSARSKSQEKRCQGVSEEDMQAMRLITGRKLSEENEISKIAGEMGPESQVVYFKAKIRVFEENVKHLMKENQDKTKEVSNLTVSLQKAESDLVTQTRLNKQAKIQIMKLETCNTDAKTHNHNMEAEINALKKEISSMHNSNSKVNASKNTTEIRLNRTLEELEKSKMTITSLKSKQTESSHALHKQVDTIRQENKRLQTQKKELITGFQKQMKLIDLYKRQKMHIEAAKLLSFTEDEFIQILDFGK